MHDLVHKYQVSPELVTTLTEEPSRNLFGNGKSVFMRNWPYGWSLFQESGSAVKDKVGISVLPHFPGIYVTHLSTGQTVFFQIPPEKLHLFKKSSGLRITATSGEKSA